MQRDGEAAKRLLREHIEKSMEEISAHLKEGFQEHLGSDATPGS
jgi:DNA-binding GntR family transcriptional regulator